MRLDGKVAIVTGGGVGIGRAYSKGLAKEGAKVAVADIQVEAASQVAEEIKKDGGDAIPVAVDVASPEKTREMADAVLKAYGRIDVLVNNAALYTALTKKSFMEIGEDEWDRVMAVNVKGLHLCVQAVYPAMKEQGKGKIINISSGTILGGTPMFLHYVTSKAGVLGFTRALAREIGPDGISVNAIMPGLTISKRQPGWRHDPPATGEPAQEPRVPARPVPGRLGWHGHLPVLRRQRLHHRPVHQRGWRPAHALRWWAPLS